MSHFVLYRSQATEEDGLESYADANDDEQGIVGQHLHVSARGTKEASPAGADTQEPLRPGHTIKAPLLRPIATAAEKKFGLDLKAEATTAAAKPVEAAPYTMRRVDIITRFPSQSIVLAELKDIGPPPLSMLLTLDDCLKRVRDGQSINDVT